jgi:ribosomal protein S18 acetylase RimI-like enzyme
MRPIAEGEADRAIPTIVAAFADDPVERWMFPELDEYRRHFPAFVMAFGGEAFAHGTAWQLDDFAAVALWLPPGAQADGEAIGRVFADAVAPEKQDELAAVAGQMDELHPHHPHWYLPWLAVHPDRQGAGLGAALLEECLARVDAERIPAYLETPNPRTVPLYERHGFEVTGQAVAGSCPPVTTMLRPAA